MNSNNPAELEEFFLHFNQHFIPWIEDLESMEGKDILEAAVFSKDFFVKILTHYADGIEKQLKVLGAEYRLHFELPTPETESEQALRALLLRLNVAAKGMLLKREIVGAWKDTFTLLETFSKITLEDVLRSS